MRYSDSGLGLNYNILSEKYKAMYGNAPTDPTMVADIIFESGVSTAANLTISSGRGEGMGAVKSLLNSCGGDIKVVLEEKKNEDYIAFSFEITVPKNSLIATIALPKVG